MSDWDNKISPENGPEPEYVSINIAAINELKSRLTAAEKERDDLRECLTVMDTDKDGWIRETISLRKLSSGKDATIARLKAERDEARELLRQATIVMERLPFWSQVDASPNLATTIKDIQNYFAKIGAGK